MNITGIIVEYNPMHNGHMYHLSKARQISKADAVVAVMSGNFVQRGEPAFANKWARTKMALMGGVDLVIELPYLYSNSSAEGFAFGAVALLQMAGVQSLCFGSECGDLSLLTALANILTQEPVSFKSFLRQELKSGISFPKARQNALTNYIITNNIENVNSDKVLSTLQCSNNILGIEYIKAIIRLSGNIEPLTITRIGSQYNDQDLSGEYSSATSIRRLLCQGSNTNVLDGKLPAFVLDILEQERMEGRSPVSLMSFSDLLLYKIRSMSPEELLQIMDMEIGLHYGMKRAAEDSVDIMEFLDRLKTKRYPSTRLQRILFSILMNVTKSFSETVKNPPSYMRVLGFTETGRKLLGTIKKNTSFKLITNPGKEDAQLLNFDIAATDLYVLGYPDRANKRAKQDLMRGPVIL